MKSRILITTADERTWPIGKPVLFLGEWCRIFTRKPFWKQLDAEVVPYHWDDRQKLYDDYRQLRQLYESLLSELSNRLNTLHGVEHTRRYWRILIGPWLGYFVQMLFDRWAMIERAIANYTIEGVRVIDNPKDLSVPNDIVQFHNMFESDAWNEMIYGQLIEEYTPLPIEKIKIGSKITFPAALNSGSDVHLGFMNRAVHAISEVSKKLVRPNEAFFLDTHLPIWNDLLLQFRLGQIPKRWKTRPIPRTDTDWNKRGRLMASAPHEGFPAIVRDMIPKHIPSLYLEGYETLCNCCSGLDWPQNPRLIFTSNAYYSDDIFKAWAAEKTEAGTPLVIGQHGGNFGTALWGFSEEHQYAISDRWLSWGWEDPKRPQIRSVGNFKFLKKNYAWNPQGAALMVEMSMPRYSYHMYAVPVASQWLDYFDDQCRFVAALPESMQRRLTVRLYGHDYGWCQKQRWQERFPDICTDDGMLPILPLIKASRIYVSTYNATTFLESLAMNIPSIIFWNPHQWELRNDAFQHFKKLKEIGIFFDNPESAAAKMIEVWDDVAGWWYQKEIQEARRAFCQRYSQLIENTVRILKSNFDAVIDETAKTGSRQLDGCRQGWSRRKRGCL